MVGKTNLDQFAAGLVGTRTPYGTARNPFDDRFLPGGSSSGSGAAVGGGLLTFALGTDTAGSGERPVLTQLQQHLVFDMNLSVTTELSLALVARSLRVHQAAYLVDLHSRDIAGNVII